MQRLSNVYTNISHETLYPPTSAYSSPPPPSCRAVERGFAPQSDPDFGLCWLWQNHTGERMACRTQGSPRVAVAWLSLDEGDSDPTRFLTYLVAALRTVAPTLGEGMLSCAPISSAPVHRIECWRRCSMRSPPLPTTLLLVLDDYHVIDAKAVDDALTFVVEHLPPQMHLVIATREDPRLPLARFRARGQLTEVRGADLRFTPAEATAFLQAMNLTFRGRRCRRTGKSHRRLDCRSAIGRAFHAGAAGCCRLYPRLRRRPSLHCGLSGRRGLAASARRCTQLLTADRHSRPVEWPAV